MTKRSFFVCLSLFWTVLQAAVAAPTLRLTLPETLRLATGEVRPVWIASSTNGPTNLSFEAWNSGSGALSLTVNGGTAAWLKPSVGGTQPCSTNSSTTCTIVRVLFDAAALANGTYQGDVVVEDANALDAPQRVPIKIYVGGNVPDEVNLYVRPDTESREWLEFETPEPADPKKATTLTAPQSSVLTVSTSGNGSFQFKYTHRITATFRSGTPVGDTSLNATISGSGFAGDNRSFPVRVHVTNDPIVQLSSSSLSFETAQDVNAPDRAIVLSNRGNGSLALSDVAVSTDSGGDWLTAAPPATLQAGGPAQAAPLVYIVSAKEGDLAPGLYTGSIQFTTNAANSPNVVKVAFEVSAQKPPEVSFRGVVNGATFSQNQPLAPGAIVSVFGKQLAYSAEQAGVIPLPKELASTKVMIGGIEAPLFYAAWGQINFQVPNEVPQGSTTVQVVRGGQAGNKVTATVQGRTSGIFRLNIGEYGAILNASQGNSFPLPVATGVAVGINARPARPGDVITIYSTGLGPVAPVVGTGQAAPAQEPLARGVDTPTVNFGRPFPVRQIPSFVGLAPGFVGLYQINVAIPDESPTNARTPLAVEYPGGGLSNTVEIAVER